MRFFLGLITSLIAVSYAEMPSWFKNDSLQRNGNTLTVNCFASGVSLEIARKLSLQSCQSTAINQLPTTIQAKSKVIETESEAIYHGEVTSDQRLTGLNCKVLKEEVIQKQDEVTVYHRCQFSLKEVHLSEVPEATLSIANGNDLVTDRNKAESIPTKISELKITPTSHKSRQLIISVSPKCDTILIVGGDSRIVHCESNPLTLKIKPTDKELIVRAKGRLPKHIGLTNNKEAVSTLSRLEVYLEK